VSGKWYQVDRTIFVAALLTLRLAGHAQAQEAVKAVVTVGDTPPDVFGNDESGQPIALAGLHGKVVIVSSGPPGAATAARSCPCWRASRKTIGKPRIEVIAVNSREDRRTIAPCCASWAS
jgi:hypothetical protein